MIDQIWNALGGRKFIMSLILIGVGTVIELKTDRGVSTSFAGLLVGILSAFSVANTITTVKTGAGSSQALPPSPPLDPVPSFQAVTDSVSELSQRIADIEKASIQVNQTLTNLGTSVANQNKVVAAFMQRS